VRMVPVLQNTDDGPAGAMALHRRLRRRPFTTSEIYTKSWNRPDRRVALASEFRAIPGSQ
jgi:hypothetical protein